MEILAANFIFLSGTPDISHFSETKSCQRIFLFACIHVKEILLKDKSEVHVRMLDVAHRELKLAGSVWTREQEEELAQLYELYKEEDGTCTLLFPSPKPPSNSLLFPSF